MNRQAGIIVTGYKKQTIFELNLKYTTKTPRLKFYCLYMISKHQTLRKKILKVSHVVCLGKIQFLYYTLKI